MDQIPESWPPPGTSASEGNVVPLFALPRVWLFPYVVLPLQIFEPRYKQMVEDCLDGPGRIALGTIQEGHEDEAMQNPPVYPIAGLGEIGRHEKTKDERYHIWLVGLQRVIIREIESDRLYRKVVTQKAMEIAIPSDREVALRSELVDSILERTEDLTTIPPQVPASHLADLLILRMPLPPDVLNRLYSELDAEKRARLALEEHAKRPKFDQSGPPPDVGFAPPPEDRE